MSLEGFWSPTKLKKLINNLNPNAKISQQSPKISREIFHLKDLNLILKEILAVPKIFAEIS